MIALNFHSSTKLTSELLFLIAFVVTCNLLHEIAISLLYAVLAVSPKISRHFTNHPSLVTLIRLGE